MEDYQFFLYTLEHFNKFIIFFFFFEILLYFSVRNLAVAGLFDPIHFVYTFTFGTTYAEICFLYFDGYISNYLFLVILLFGILFYISLIFFSKVNQSYLRDFLLFITPKKHEKFTLKNIFLIYFSISIFIIFSKGFLSFASTNRFDVIQGWGIFIRILDTLSIFIIAYLSIYFYGRSYSSRLRKYLSYSFIFLIILFFSFLDGAKASFLYGIMTVILSIRAYGFKFNISFKQIIIFLLISTFFALLFLAINLEKNGIDPLKAGKYINVPIVFEMFMHRILANGDQSYMGLPNNIIDLIEKDSFFIRLLTPIIGITNMSKILGYRVDNLDVGRQILLYHSYTDVAGGPTSHFDLFSYAYLGIGGIIFVIFIGYVLGSINYLLRVNSRKKEKSIFYTSILVTLWVRVTLIILEPPVGLAYMFDVIIIFFILKIYSNFLIMSIKGVRINEKYSNNNSNL